MNQATLLKEIWVPTLFMTAWLGACKSRHYHETGNDLTVHQTQTRFVATAPQVAGAARVAVFQAVEAIAPELKGTNYEVRGVMACRKVGKEPTCRILLKTPTQEAVQHSLQATAADKIYRTAESLYSPEDSEGIEYWLPFSASSKSNLVFLLTGIRYLERSPLSEALRELASRSLAGAPGRPAEYRGWFVCDKPNSDSAPACSLKTKGNEARVPDEEAVRILADIRSAIIDSYALLPGKHFTSFFHFKQMSGQGEAVEISTYALQGLKGPSP